MGEYEGFEDLLDSEFEFSVKNETPDGKKCYTETGVTDSHLTSKTGALNSRSFLSTLSDDSLIEYVNQLSQTNKKNHSLTTGTPRFTIEKACLLYTSRCV